MDTNAMKNKIEEMKTKIIGAVDAYIKDDKEKNEIFEAALIHLKQYEGKQITSRLESFLEKKMPSCQVHYLTQYGMTRLAIKDEATKCEIMTTVAYDGQKIFSCESYEKLNACYGSAAKERIKQNQAFLDNRDNLTKLAGNIVLLEQAVENISDCLPYPQVPAYFSILESIGIRGIKGILNR